MESSEFSNNRSIAVVGVVGAGVMGLGVSQALLETGHQVVLIENSHSTLKQAKNRLHQQLRMSMMMGRINRNTDLDSLLGQVVTDGQLSALEPVDFVIENVTEQWAVKAQIYPAIDKICRHNCVFAANTSAIPITRIASLTQRPGQIIGIHFMNPVALKHTVEVINGYHTSDRTLAITATLLRQLGKDSIVVKDGPGFVSNRISHLFMNEAIWVVQDKLAKAKDVDEIFIQCYNHKIGPLATADLIGLDTVLNTLEVLYENALDSKFRPAPLLRQMVTAGLLGQKSGQGFYQY
ncbi:3-hydroxyacyl-CoA dehydrogenase family protein [Microbulbifer sp. ZKSA006]|uniref:3-hydroxyacyl-CoA dehydrogenase family protein n=1 Tax=Microbulbifer sp. ZKSA006 TaxID=3243390 RepID=UPI0040397E30